MAATAPSAPVPVRSPLPWSLAGRTAVILGGSSGIGLAAAELLASVGARILLVGRDKDRLDSALTRVTATTPHPDPANVHAAARDTHLGAVGSHPGATGVHADTAGVHLDAAASTPDADDAHPGTAASYADVRAMSADVTDDEAMQEVFEYAGSIDHVLVTAGYPSGIGPVAELTRDAARTAVAAPVGAVLGIVRAAVPRMEPGGSITLTSGVLVARPRPGMAAPVSAAGAVETLARALAVELAPARIRANAVRYGAIGTPLLRSRFGAPGAEGDAAMAEAGAGTPLGRFGTAEEAASAALFLMANPYMSGEVLTVDGAQSLA
ncbi:SDR family NAD(P)-dependent oxidoreductase [Actinomadura bangladeshensis]|nr:SDR family oxidoreductase [Actinomadura bangladeshensis]